MRQRLIYACAQSLLVSAELVPALEPAGPSSEVAQSVNGPASNFSQAQRPQGCSVGPAGHALASNSCRSVRSDPGQEQERTGA